MERQDFTFESGGDRLIGNLFLPGQQPIAAIVTTGPLTSVKEQAPGAYARALAERGFAALAFDHCYFGKSDGQPRQFENPMAKVEDIRAAVSALQNDKRTQGLPVMAVGICAGGGYMAVAVVQEDRFRAFAGIAGVYSDSTATRQWLEHRFCMLRYDLHPFADPGPPFPSPYFDLSSSYVSLRVCDFCC